jgi:DNA polymerase-1
MRKDPGMPEAVLIDGHYFAFRFFYGMPPLTGPGGRPTGITYAYAKLFRQLLDDERFSHWALVLDHRDPSFRHIEFPAYKAHRDPAPPDLIAQLPDLERLAAANGIPVVSIPGYEADDVLATLARRFDAAGIPVRLCTKDKDIDQVLSDRVRTWDPGKDELRGPDALRAEKGIAPDRVIDWLCLVGDTADNVPGVKGVGPKKATALIAAHGSLEMVLAAADQQTPALKANLIAFAPQAELTRRLITLVDVPEVPDLSSLAVDRDRPIDGGIYEELGFKLAVFAPVKRRQASEDAAYRILGAADLPALAAELRAAGRFAIDTETTGLDPITADLVGISLAWGPADTRAAVYLPVRGLDHDGLIPLADLHAHLAPVLADAGVGKVAQHAKYDLRVLARHGLPVRGLDGDPMLASWLLDPSRESHGIDALTAHFLQEDKISTGQVVDLAGGQTMAEVPVATVARYACEDAQCCWRLALLLEGKLAELGLLAVYRDQEIPIEVVLAGMESAGFPVSADILATTQTHLQGYLDQVMVDIRRHAGPLFNPASPKQIAALLYDKLGLPALHKTKTGPSTDAAALEAIRHLHELPDLLLQHRALSKLIGTYLARLPDFIVGADGRREIGAVGPGRIHTHFRQTGTETGRLSSDQPNLQNIPKKSDLGRELRAAFAPGPGRVLIAADYSQIELRVLAHLSGDDTLRAAFHANHDIHRFVAAQVHGIPEDQVTPRQRNAAKAVNFGVIYGQSAFGLSQQLGIPRGEAQAFIDDYFTRFAGVAGYIKRVVDEATMRGYASTLAGRRRYIPQLALSNRNERLHGERVALNSTIQGSAADLIKQAMLRFDRRHPPEATLVLQVHDELIVEAPESHAADAAAALTDAMAGAWEFTVPLVAEARIGRTWLEVS